ncbi:hypothetical protein P8452_32264 [Trifolium repens]|nr:hypothetical protein P8452_32264 [Trifolium repens]
MKLVTKWIIEVGITYTEWQSSSGVVQKNLDTRLAKPTVIPPGDAIRKAAIAEKIMLLQKKNQFKSSGRLNFDGEEVTVNGESCGEKLVKDGKNNGVGDGEASAVAKLKDQKVEVLAETKRLAGEPSKKDDLGSSGVSMRVLCLIVVLIDMPRYIYNKKAGIVHQGINQ